MTQRDYLGEFEHIIVLALLRLDDRAYGVTVRQEIEFRTNREVSIGAVYATLDRLETKGYVKSHLGDLLEEFSHVASKSGVSVARSWYWRQTVKTVAHFVVTGFRVAPWSTTLAVAGGFLLRRLVSGLPELAIFAVLHRYRVFDHHFS